MKFKESNIQFINEEHRENLEDFYEKLCKKRERMLIAEFLEDLKYIHSHGNTYTWMKLKRKWEQRKEGKIEKL